MKCKVCLVRMAVNLNHRKVLCMEQIISSAQVWHDIILVMTTSWPWITSSKRKISRDRCASCSREVKHSLEGSSKNSFCQGKIGNSWQEIQCTEWFAGKLSLLISIKRLIVHSWFFSCSFIVYVWRWLIHRSPMVAQIWRKVMGFKHITLLPLSYGTVFLKCARKIP